MKPYYNEDGITIYCGDNRDILPQIGTNYSAVITDPPYNVGKDYGKYKDNLSGVAYAEFMNTIINMSRDIAKNQAWVAPRYKLPLFLELMPKSHMVVVRRGARGPYRQGWSDQYEIILTEGKPVYPEVDLWEGIRLKGEGYFFREDTWGHPGYTPISIMKKLIVLLGGGSGGIIVDPFSGTGTSLRAAKDLGAMAIGIELDEKWCEIAAKRMSQGVLPFTK